MRIDIISREYPPNVYGGAGVHVEELTRALRTLADVRVHAFDHPVAEPGTQGYDVPAPWSADGTNPALKTVATDLAIVPDLDGADLVHTHTWYANLAGVLGGTLYGVPHVLTAHSLEPLRPWKAEQLGGGYRLSSWIEEQAYRQADRVIAVSAGMKRDILRCYPFLDDADVSVIHNGIDTDKWRPTDDPQTLAEFGIEVGRPTVVFVGRITRQKGLPYFLRAVPRLDPGVQVVLCAGAPDTQEILDDVRALVGELQRERDGVVWIDEMLPRPKLAAILTASDVFVCPSVYEPLGIVNLEAMACGTAVVATATGGIPEVVEDGVTGRLVPIDQIQDGTGTPNDPERFVADLADALTDTLERQDTEAWGRAGRERAKQHFSWGAIAEKTLALYCELV